MPHNFRFMTVTLKEPPQVSLTKAQGGTAGHNGGGGCTNAKLGLTFDDAREKTLFERWQGLLNDREKLSLLYHTLSNQPVMMEDMESTNQGQVSQRLQVLSDISPDPYIQRLVCFVFVTFRAGILPQEEGNGSTDGGTNAACGKYLMVMHSDRKVLIECGVY
jgi:hypothetical protein